MRAYYHHLGDYALATRHLSWDEDMAYTRMLRVYYETELPLPSDPAEVAWRIGANSPKRVKIVLGLLKTFFTHMPDGWHQNRCDEEIQLAGIKRITAINNGKNGGRPKNPEKPTLVIIGTQEKAIQSPVSSSSSSRRLEESEILSKFTEFWSAYPRRDAKQKALKAFAKLAPSDDLLATMLAAIKKQIHWQKWQDGYIPHASTWLNEKRWTDEEPPTASHQNGTAQPKPQNWPAFPTNGVKP